MIGLRHHPHTHNQQQQQQTTTKTTDNNVKDNNNKKDSPLLHPPLQIQIMGSMSFDSDEGNNNNAMNVNGNNNKTTKQKNKFKNNNNPNATIRPRPTQTLLNDDNAVNNNNNGGLLGAVSDSKANGTITGPLSHTTPTTKEQDPLGHPASHNQRYHKTAQASRNQQAASFQVQMTEAQLKASLDRFGSEEQDTLENTQNVASLLRSLVGGTGGEGEEPLELDEEQLSPPPSPLPPQASACSVIMGAVACLCSATLGAGILSLPYAMAEAGIVFGMGMLVASAAATALSIQLLVQAMQVVYYSPNSNNDNNNNNNSAVATTQSEEKTYEDLVEICLGTKARRLSEASMLIFCGGGAVAYVIAVGDILQQSGLLEHLIKQISSPTLSRALAMSLVWGVAMVPLSMLRTMKSLECTSSIGIGSIATLVLAALYHYLEHHNDNGNSTMAFLQDDDNKTHSILVPTQGLLSILRACPIILFAFSCQVNVCAIFDEMPGGEQSSSFAVAVEEGLDEETPAPSTMQTQQSNYTAKYRRMNQVTWLAVGICAFLYSSISIIALLDFGSTDMTPNILSRYNPESVMQVAFIGMTLAVVLAYPMNIFPARVTLLGIFRARKLAQQGQSQSNLNDNNDSSVVPNGLYPSFSNDNNDSLVEPLLSSESQTTTDGSFHSAISGEHEEVTLRASNLLPASSEAAAAEENPQTTAPDETTGSTTADTDSLVEHVVSTLFLTGASLGLAIVAPNISVVFGLLGGTCSSVLGFVLPGLLGYKTANDFHKVGISSSSGGGTNNDATNRGAAARTRVLSAVLVVAGILVGIITTAVTIYSTFATPPKHSNSILTIWSA